MQKVKVVALRPFLGNEGKIRAGETVEVSEPRARELERLKLATTVLGGKMQPAPQNKAEEGAPANKAAVDPTRSPQTGGQTGAAKPASSSAPARQRRTSASAATADAGDGSPSTALGSSRRGRTSSTRATSRGGKGKRASKNSKA